MTKVIMADATVVTLKGEAVYDALYGRPAAPYLAAYPGVEESTIGLDDVRRAIGARAEIASVAH